jgi:hypothetical protein
MLPMAEIPSEYWQNADFAYFFLFPDEESRRLAHTHADGNTMLPKYYDLFVSHAQALRVWPQPASLAISSDVVATESCVVATLRSYRTELSNVKVVFWSNIHRPFADKVQSVFKLANWDVTFIGTAQESYNPHYVAGIEVRGVNAYLLSVVARAIQDLGGWNVKTIVFEPETRKDNPKWPRLQQSVRITIGHRES